MQHGAERTAPRGAVDIEIEGETVGQARFDAPPELAPGVGFVAGRPDPDAGNVGREARMHVEGVRGCAGEGAVLPMVTVEASAPAAEMVGPGDRLMVTVVLLMGAPFGVQLVPVAQFELVPPFQVAAAASAGVAAGKSTAASADEASITASARHVFVLTVYRFLDTAPHASGVVFLLLPKQCCSIFRHVAIIPNATNIVIKQLLHAQVADERIWPMETRRKQVSEIIQRKMLDRVAENLLCAAANGRNTGLERLAIYSKRVYFCYRAVVTCCGPLDFAIYLLRLPECLKPVSQNLIALKKMVQPEGGDDKPQGDGGRGHKGINRFEILRIFWCPLHTPKMKMSWPAAIHIHDFRIFGMNVIRERAANI